MTANDDARATAINHVMECAIDLAAAREAFEEAMQLLHDLHPDLPRADAFAASGLTVTEVRELAVLAGAVSPIESTA